jgi:succinate dehydrogenase / fumarate reductase, flavoprotein subunit
MGGLWVDYNLMTTVNGPVCHRRIQLFRPRREPTGRRLVDAVLQAKDILSFLLLLAIFSQAKLKLHASPPIHPEFEKAEKEVKDKINKLLSINGKQTPSTFHRRLGKIMWDYCGMVRNEEGLKTGTSTGKRTGRGVLERPESGRHRK